MFKNIRNEKFREKYIQKNKDTKWKSGKDGQDNFE